MVAALAASIGGMMSNMQMTNAKLKRTRQETMVAHVLPGSEKRRAAAAPRAKQMGTQRPPLWWCWGEKGRLARSPRDAIKGNLRRVID